MFNIGTRIKVNDHHWITGTVVGFATYQSAHYATMHPAYCVRLDKGHWVDDNKAFIDTVLVSADRAEEIE